MRIEVTPSFARRAKRLIKKFASFQEELQMLFASLLENPDQGNNLGNGCYKIRLGVASKGKGKRGDFRIITYIVIEDEVIYMLTIYDKSETEDISDKELKRLINQIDKNENDV